MRLAPAAARSAGSTTAACPRSARTAPAPTRGRPVTATAAREPTITDSSAILGLIDPEKFWGGAVTLDVAAAAHGLRGQRRGARPAARAGRLRLPRHRDHPHGDGDRESQPRPRLRPARLHRDRLRRRLRPLHRRGLPRPRDRKAGDAAGGGDLLRLRAAVRRRDPRRGDDRAVDLRGRLGRRRQRRSTTGCRRKRSRRCARRATPTRTSRSAARPTSSSPASRSRSR